MQVYQWNSIEKLAVKQIGKRAVAVHNGLDYDDPEGEAIWQFILNEMQSIYGDATREYYDVMTGLLGTGLFFFDTEEDQYRFYKVFEQPLTDSSAVYACTYDENGECQTENT